MYWKLAKEQFGQRVLLYFSYKNLTVIEMGLVYEVHKAIILCLHSEMQMNPLFNDSCAVEILK